MSYRAVTLQARAQCELLMRSLYKHVHTVSYHAVTSQACAHCEFNYSCNHFTHTTNACITGNGLMVDWEERKRQIVCRREEVGFQFWLKRVKTNAWHRGSELYLHLPSEFTHNKFLKSVLNLWMIVSFYYKKDWNLITSPFFTITFRRELFSRFSTRKKDNWKRNGIHRRCQQMSI